MTFAIVNQIAKTLLSQKEIILSFVKKQNNAQVNKFAEQYQGELDKLKTINDELHSRQNGKLPISEASNIENRTEIDKFNQFKSQLDTIKNELAYLKSKKEYSENINERVKELELNYANYKKNQEFFSDLQFSEFLSVYNSTMESTRESIGMNHEDIMKLKALTTHLQHKLDNESIINSIRCLKHEIKLIKKSQYVKASDFLQTINDIKKKEDQLSANISDLRSYKSEIKEIINQLKKVNEIEQNLQNITSNIGDQNIRNDIARSTYDEFSSSNYDKGYIEDQSNKYNKSSNEIKIIEEINVHKDSFNNLPTNLLANVERQYKEFKSIKISIDCLKHEMRKMKVQFEDNVMIAARVDTLYDKLKRLKEKIKLEYSSPSSPKRNGANLDDDDIQKIQSDLQTLKENFVHTFSMQNSSITSQSNQIKALRKLIDDNNSSKNDKNINDRLKVIETKLQIITSLASAT